VLFNNNAVLVYYSSLGPDRILYGEGRIPSLDSEGSADTYVVDGFEIAYCTDEIIGANIEIRAAWFNCYDSCKNPLIDGGLNDQPAILLGETEVRLLPGTTAAGELACWTVTIDLAGSGDEFVIEGDCDLVFDDAGVAQNELDSFGWGLHFAGLPDGPGGTGLIIAGDPNDHPFGAGTVPDWGFAPGPLGTGLGEIDQYYIDDLADNSFDGCYWFGGYFKNQIWGGHYHRLFGDEVDEPCGVVTVTCTPSTFSSGLSTIRANDEEISIAANNLVLSADNLPADPPQPGVFIAGNQQVEIPFLNGSLCIDPGGLQRFATVNLPDASGVVSQVVDLATAAPGGLAVVANALHYFQRWNRDPAAGGASANFSSVVAVCFVP